MQGIEMSPGGETEDQANQGRGNQRTRMKKKSTLAKLKERKEREMGSNTSLQKQISKESIRQPSEEIDLEPKKLHHSQSVGSVPSLHQNGRKVNDSEGQIASSSKNNVHLSASRVDDHHISNQSAQEQLKEDRKPRPKPRARRQSSEISDGSSWVGNDLTLPDKDHLRSKNVHSYQSSGQQPDSVESMLGHSGFVPKPPLTPRTPRSTPRTPRGYVVTGKGEKRNRELCSSGEEVEVEDKEEKSNGVDLVLSSTRNSRTMELDATDGATSNTISVSGSRRIPGQVRTGERLLKRRSLGEAEKERKENISVKAGDLGKPPISRSLVSIKDNRNNCNNNSSQSLNNLDAGSDHLVLHNTPKEKYIKSSNRSKHKTSPTTQQTLPESHQLPKSDSEMEHHKLDVLNSPRNSTQNFSSGDGANETVEFLHLQYENLLLTEIDNSNKSTQVIYTSPSPLTVRSISSPPNSARLNPIPSKSHPPPMLEEMSSQSLRTAYKIDQNIPPGTGSTHTGEKTDSGNRSYGDCLSQKSFASGGVLPVITTKEARSRSFLEGSISSGTPSMLGPDELDRYFPERKVNVLVGTWNVNELKEMTISLDDFILPEKCDYIQDIYAIGTQENALNKKEWEVKVQETLGPSHVMYHSVTLGSLHLVIFIRRDLIWFCSAPEEECVSLRAVTMVKTKGAIAISLSLFGTSYLFINCHLTSDRDNDNTRKKNRLGDYFKVIQEMKFPKSTQNSSSSKKTNDITALFDCVFWCGDLNFRIEHKRSAVEGKVNQISAEEFPNFETLLGGDQLLKYMAEGKIFGGFQEGRINFLPTFKFDVNQDTYDSSSKNRVPSYTDRIMFRSKKKNDITCLHYDSVMAIKASDHRPVYGQFETRIKPGRDNVVYSGGHFDRSVYMEANRRRAVNRPQKKKQSAVCSVQ